MQERKTMLRTVCMLSWPTVLEQALQTGAQYVDTAMVGRIGMQASAAVGLTASAMWLITGPLAAIGMGVLSCISKAIGAEDRQKAGIACNQTVLLTLATGVLFGAIALGISPFLPDWLGAGREIRRDAFRYFFITSLPMVFRAAAVIFGAAIRATGNTRTPMKITAISLLVNISLNYFLISPSRVLFLGPLRFHIWGGGLGVTGAAVATALAYVLNGVLMFAALRRSPYFRICGEGLRPCRPVIAECLGVGLPAAGQRFIIYVGHMLFTAMVARLGTLAVAIHSIALTAEEAFYIPGYGMQAAAATLAGNAAGRQNLEQLRQVARTTTLLSTVIMTALSLLLFLFPEHVMALFTTDRRVIEGGGRVLRIVSVSEPLFAVAVIMEGIFDGVGDVKAPFLISTLSLWAVRLVPTWLCVTRFGLGLEVVWICMVGDNVLRCLLLLGCFFGRNWKAYLEKKLVRPGDRDGQRS